MRLPSSIPMPITLAQTRLGVLHNWSARFSPGFTLEWKTLYNQLSTSETVVRTGAQVAEGYDVRSYSERFENRSILTTQLAGEHTISPLTKISWVGSFGYTGRWEPDWKRARYLRATGCYQEPMASRRLFKLLRQTTQHRPKWGGSIRNCTNT